MDFNIPGIDEEKAIKNSGSLELFTELLGDVYKLMDEKTSLIETYLKDNDIKNYTVLVHSLKTTCRMIGATKLGEDFFTLEKLGKENNLEQIKKLTPDVLNSFRSLKPYLEPFVYSTAPQNSFDKDAFSAILKKLIAAIDDFDLGAADSAVRQLFTYNCNDELSGRLKKLDSLVTNLDYDDARHLATKILESLEALSDNQA